MQTLIIGDVPKEFRDMIAAMSQEDFERIMGTPAEMKEQLQQLACDEAFLQDKQLEEQYPGMWVAAHKGEVLAVAETWRELGDALRARGLGRTQRSIRQMPG